MLNFKQKYELDFFIQFLKHNLENINLNNVINLDIQMFNDYSNDIQMFNANELIAQATWSCEAELPLSTFKSYSSHVLFASIYWNYEIWIKWVSRVQILVEEFREKHLCKKNKNMSSTECLQIGYGNISDKANCWAK